VSTSIGALTALAVLFLYLRSRGVILLLAADAFLTIDYILGLALFAPSESTLWQGLTGFAAAGERAAITFGLKGLCHVGSLLTAPLAVTSILGRTPRRAALVAGAGASAAFLAAVVCLMAGLIPRHPLLTFVISALPGYTAYVICLVVLVRDRAAARPGLHRGIRRAATIAMSLFVPALLIADIIALSGVGPRILPIDPVAFSVLNAGILVCSLLVLLGSRRRPPAVEIDTFCAEHELSVREREVLLLLGQGLRYKQIGDRLCISLDTVKTHVSSIYRKTSSTGKTDLFYRIRLGTP
jgi:DNA-binding CsgD family transcriptional regulator